MPRGPQAETKAVDMELSDLASEDAICSFRGGTRDVPLLDSEKPLPCPGSPQHMREERERERDGVVSGER